MKKVISFSLWGHDKKYLEGALRNAELAQEIYQDWNCIYYIKDIPDYYYSQLKQFQNVKLYNGDDRYGVFWRFNELFTGNDYSIIRDCDSRLSKREYNYVQEWINSSKSFFIIRDHPRHFDFPILAGMFGLKGKFDEKLKNKILYYNNFKYLDDQIYLANEIWPLIKMDNYQCGCDLNGYCEGRDSLNFIGQSYDENNRPIYLT